MQSNKRNKRIILRTVKVYNDKKVQREEERKRRMIDSSPLLLILYICGCAGIIMSLADLLSMPANISFLLLGFVTLMNLAFWYLYTRHGKMFIYVTTIMTFICTLILVPQVYSLTVRIKYMVLRGISLNLLTIDTMFIVITVFLITFFLFCLEFVVRSHSIMLAGGLALMLIVPIFGHTMSIPTLLLLGAFELGFIVVNMSERRSPRNVMTMPKRSHINVLSVILILCITAAAFLPALIIERSSETELFSLANNTDNFIKEVMTQITGNTSSDGVNNGNINRGNLYQSGRNQLIVSVSKRPSSNLYLRGYTGKDYSDSTWSNAYGFHQTSFNSTWEYTESFIGNVFSDSYTNYTGGIPYSFYYLMYDTSDPISEMYFMLAETTELNPDYFEIVEIDGTNYLQVNAEQESAGYVQNPEATRLYINNVSSRSARSFFTPYYNQKSEGRLAAEGIRYNGYSNLYLDESSINIHNQWDNNEIYNRLVNTYMNHIKQQYISYPADTFSRLEELCRAEPLTDLNDITTFILVTLQNKCTYSTTPGNTPYNKDVIDYFLFDNGQGYCVHFASAAALMYRMYGIPARYVTGYVASPSDFVLNQQFNGYYSATLTDKSAHAWVEIFLKDYGWVPVEVTPNSDDVMRASYPGYNETIMYSIMAKHNWKFRGEDTGSSTDDGNGEIGNFADNAPDLFTILTIILIIIIIGLIIFILLRRRHILASLPSYSCQRLFDRMIKVLHYSKLLKDCNGSEEDFSKQLSQVVPSLTPDDTARIIDIMLQVNYSDTKPSKDDRDFLEQSYRTLSHSLYTRTPFYKKPFFKYLHAYC